MLSIFDGEQGVSRRRFLTIGGLGLGGLSLPTLYASGGSDSEAVTGKSVIFLFQQGGPSQFETFDPKMEIPLGNRTIGGCIPTSIPGVTFGSSMERLAKLAHKLTIVRSFHTKNSGHNIKPIVGPDSLEANIGTHYSRVVGTTHPLTGMPTNSVIYPRTVNSEVPGPSARGNLAATGPYGKGLAPFTPGSDGQLQEDMKLRLDRGRNDTRRQLLSQLDRLNRKVDSGGQLDGLDKLQGQAYELILGGGVSRALDLSREDPRTLKRYDTSVYAKKGYWNKVSRGRKGYYCAQASTIGPLLLLARRLCEAGCGFVTIHAGYEGVWDMHADGNNLNMVDGMEAVGRSFDHAVAAFVDDTEERGLSDRILLVATGEMGRTPKINKNGGRDHWARLAPLLLYGGGLEGGRVIGRSDRQGGEPVVDGCGPSHLISTILHTVFNPGKLRIKPDAPREVLALSEKPPIPGLF
ncbi:MAG: DUF1501 domain-containing protein [Planctomycetota bacterium]|nr:DUF1501 domain-containing protein [Planctomycetota bacterium]